MSEEVRAYAEAVDDAEAASVGRTRMADGRRLELSVGELARMVEARIEGSSGSDRRAQAGSG